MAGFECDTERLKDDAKKISDYIEDYQKQVDSFFRELDNLAANGVWSGKNSTLYRNQVAPDKQEYVSFGNGINAIAKEMLDYADSLEGKVRSNESEYDSSR